MNAQNQYAPGKHVLLDFWGAKGPTDQLFIEAALKKAAEACGATVLAVKLHAFGENSGITGVALLAESHISIHTWPEADYMALDIFMCGSCDADEAIEPLREIFHPEKVTIKKIQRGLWAETEESK
ncbi:MAG: adenosylmethionine decarboxylase [Thermodesulfobacteriota bacterium]